MDRRRFIPATEALDVRALLSSLFGGTPKVTNNQLQLSHETYLEKLRRIQNLPYYMQQLQPGRTLPPGTIQALQTDLTSVAANLRPVPAGSAVLSNFNLQIRDTLPRTSLSPENAAKLNQLFGAVIAKGNATPQQVSNLQADLNQFARGDSQNPNPVYLATNDYATLVQTTMLIGRPIQTPDKPLISLKDGIRGKTASNAVTNKALPTFVGYYRVGNVIDPGTRVQIITMNGEVLGSGVVARSGANQGKYSLTFDQPLSPGLHYLRIQAVDVQGHVSTASPLFAVKVVVPRIANPALTPPAGPLGLK